MQSKGGWEGGREGGREKGMVGGRKEGRRMKRGRKGGKEGGICLHKLHRNSNLPKLDLTMEGSLHAVCV